MVKIWLFHENGLLWKNKKINIILVNIEGVDVKIQGKLKVYYAIFIWNQNIIKCKGFY
jgi:hypothetical protein